MKLYIDMDGVLMDFEGAIQAHGVVRYPDGLHWITRPRGEWPQEMVDADTAYVVCMAKLHFWDTLKPMPDAHVLWSYLRGFHGVELLTAAPSDRPGDTTFAARFNRIASQKMESIWQNFDPNFPAEHINVCLRHEKAKFAGPGHILVDDTPGNCAEWTAAGGIAILHTDATTTIRKLQELIHV